ncbi:MAG: hypothetical protein QM733_07060 [Ilumatobacteraceae bacterium]
MASVLDLQTIGSHADQELVAWSTVSQAGCKQHWSALSYRCTNAATAFR